MRQLFAIPLLAFLAAAQEPAPKKETAPKSPLAGNPGDVEIGEPGVEIKDESLAKAEVKVFDAAYAKAKHAKDFNACVDLLLGLGKKDHPLILDAAKKRATDRNIWIATAAAVCIARQKSSAPEATRCLLALVRRSRSTKVRCAAVVGLGTLGYTSAYHDAERLYKKDMGELRKACARYFGYTKAKAAFRLLAEELDEPFPEAIDSPGNPPSAWWKRRWHAWKENRKAIQWAINQLVEGETFETTTEARKWAEAHGKEHGIDW